MGLAWQPGGRVVGSLVVGCGDRSAGQVKASWVGRWRAGDVAGVASGQGALVAGWADGCPAGHVTRVLGSYWPSQPSTNSTSTIE